MEKITRKAFIETLCGNMTVFLGCTRQSAEKVEECLDSILAGTFDGKKILEHRTAKQRSNFIEFTGGSRLYFDQSGTKTCYHVEKMGYHVYIFERVSTDCFGKIDYHTCVYVVDN